MFALLDRVFMCAVAVKNEKKKKKSSDIYIYIYIGVIPAAISLLSNKNKCLHIFKTIPIFFFSEDLWNSTVILFEKTTKFSTEYSLTVYKRCAVLYSYIKGWTLKRECNLPAAMEFSTIIIINHNNVHIYFFWKSF